MFLVLITVFFNIVYFSVSTDSSRYNDYPEDYQLRFQIFPFVPCQGGKNTNYAETGKNHKACSHS
jgi:hypothetical protein